MRDAFISAFYDLAEKDPRVLLLSGDIGYKVFDKFRAQFPDRFLNTGIAEQNMIGMSAGMAMEGLRPFVYTIIPFLTMRAFEQIRVDLCMHNLPVRLIGVGGGLSYGALGSTHHSIEDIAIMRVLPRMTVIVPCDPTETRILTKQLMHLEGPSYLRLGKNGEANINPEKSVPYKIGKAITLCDGDDATIIGCGSILGEAIKAHDILKHNDIHCRVINMHTIKPLDEEVIIKAACETQAIITVEEHSIIGGLGSAVAEIIAEEGLSGVPFTRAGIVDKFTDTVGDQGFLLKKHALTAEALVEGILMLLEFRKLKL